jgi:hypothetical protein
MASQTLVAALATKKNSKARRMARDDFFNDITTSEIKRSEVLSAFTP